MWNNNPGFPGNNNAPYPPPGGYGAAPFFPAPGGFGTPTNNDAPPPFHTGYAPAYPPPQGPPQSGFPNPGGFQSQYPPPNSNNPGAFPNFPPSNQGYPTPSGPSPGQYPSPAGPPPSQYQPPPGPPGQNPWNSPSGPPRPGPPHSGPPHPPSNQGGYPGQQGQQGPNSFNHNSGGFPGSNVNGPPPGYPPSQGPPSIPGNRPTNPPSNAQPHMPSFERQFVGVGNQGQQFAYQYSQCNGKKKALCIGINYRGQQAELKGCINDALNVKRFLCTTYGYKEEDIVMLTDDAKNPRQLPTTRNIIEAMKWLVRDAKPNDSLFFHYSGHGGQTKDYDGDEEDGYDEVIYPVDYKTGGHIVDDTMHDIMVKPLPAGCRLTAIFDCCHSGSSLDLPYMYSTEGKIKEPNLAAEVGQGLMGMVSSYAKKDMGGMLKGGLGVLRAAGGGSQKAGEKAKKTRTSPADVISWSGCKDSQTSADTVEAGQATGAMSHAFITVLSQNKNLSYQQMLVGIRAILKAKYSQKPQLAASHPIDTSVYFIC